MRLAVSGSHSTGKSSLIAAFLERVPEYVHEPEAFETLADEVPLTRSGRPTLGGLEALLRYSMEIVGNYEPGTRVIFERSPVDYLAYAVASGDGWSSVSGAGFVDAQLPSVRGSLRSLDAIALLPASEDGPIVARAGEDDEFRRRVDEELRRALLDDPHELFAAESSPVVVELSRAPERQVAELVGLTNTEMA